MKAQLPFPAPPKAAQDPVGILGEQSPGGCLLSMLLCDFIEAGSSSMSASKGE